MPSTANRASIRAPGARLSGPTPGLLALGAVLFLSSCTGSAPEALPCRERAVFGPPGESPYVLPYPVGETHWLNQSYCNPGGGHRNQLAYDFLMKIGSKVTAARAGRVRNARTDLPDAGNAVEPGRHNHVMIEHEDGTVGFYAHLQQNSILVKPGDEVSTGQHLGNSGNSGNTMGEPHLHFGVYQAWPCVEGFDVPVNFRNSPGDLDERGGLIAGRPYEALPYED